MIEKATSAQRLLCVGNARFESRRSKKESCEIAATLIAADTTKDQFVAPWLHGKSPHIIHACGDDVAAYVDNLVGALATPPGAYVRPSHCSRLPPGWVPAFDAGAVVRGPALEQKLAEASSPNAECSRFSKPSRTGPRPCFDSAAL